ncbi:amino acid ABC transporter permease [Candidatus Enterococcus willemsii]|uniref:Cysteine ABC transporter permease n=2 Tax=Enterococcus TaxID=1350 RepID=A0ABQ6Z0W7_9ENTE|nr:amino acid ABC transporter permease [Enterococcus sp. CU12B]KAF1304956.1 cysteine ABC transporter permease [Enterococcus sp. CU12B]
MERLLLIFQESFIKILEAGIRVTIPLAFFSFLVGIVLAVLVACARLSSNSILQKFAAFYVWIIRGTPLLVQLYIIYFGLPSIGILFDPWPAGIFAFAVNFAAYASESIRGAITSVPKGQIEAAESLGMSSSQVFLRIVLPQAVRVAIPALMGNFISLVKQTSLASTVTIMDLMLTANRYVSRYYETMLIYLEVAVIYLLFTTILTWLQHKVEKHFSMYV